MSDTLFRMIFGEAPTAGVAPAGTILVGTNGKDRSDLALRNACALGSRLGYLVRVQTIFDHEAPADAGEKAMGALEQAVRACGDAASRIGAGALRLPDHFDNEEHGRAHSLLQMAGEVDAALLVVGRHEGTRPLTGTMTEKLLREGGAPVLIAVNDPPRAYQKVMIAVDFSAFSDLAIDVAAMIAPGAYVHLVHAYAPVMRSLRTGVAKQDGVSQAEKSLEGLIEQQLQRLTAPRADHGLTFVPHVVEGSPKDVLRGKVEDLAPDLLIMGTHGRTGAVKAVLGSVAAPFIDNPPCDLVAIKAW